jgi:hypothetical protein
VIAHQFLAFAGESTKPERKLGACAGEWRNGGES